MANKLFSPDLPVEQVLKIGREFQDQDRWRGAHYDTARLLCDTIERLNQKLKEKRAEMTYEEYQKIYEEWEKTDSIKRKEELEEQIYDAALGLMKRLIGLYAKYGKKYVQDDDYRDDRGCISLDKEELKYGDGGTKRIWLRYTDHWKYGGECDFGIDVYMRYLDEKKIQELEDQLIDERIELLKKKIDEANAGIRVLEESQTKYCKELSDKNKMKEEREKQKQKEKEEAEERAWQDRIRRTREETAMDKPEAGVNV